MCEWKHYIFRCYQLCYLRQTYSSVSLAHTQCWVDCRRLGGQTRSLEKHIRAGTRRWENHPGPDNSHQSCQSRLHHQERHNAQKCPVIRLHKRLDVITANLYLKVRPRVTNISKNPPDCRMKMTKDKEEDDLPPDKEAKLAQGGEEARGKGGGHTAKKRHHLEGPSI